jgi:hypothetical protein
MGLGNEQLQTLAGELCSVTERRKALEREISNLQEPWLFPDEYLSLKNCWSEYGLLGRQLGADRCTCSHNTIGIVRTVWLSFSSFPSLIQFHFDWQV